MHALQPKHIKLKSDEIKKLVEKYNIAVSQLPKISLGDPAVPDGCMPGDVLRIEREDGGKPGPYFRVVVP